MGVSLTPLLSNGWRHCHEPSIVNKITGKSKEQNLNPLVYNVEIMNLAPKQRPASIVLPFVERYTKH